MVKDFIFIAPSDSPPAGGENFKEFDFK